MNQYDIERAFEDIEKWIIDRMIDRFKKDRAKGQKGAYKWQDWRLRQLKSAKSFTDEIRERFGKTYKTLNNWINDLIGDSFDGGIAEQLEQTPEDEFSNINRTRMEALQKATTEDLSAVEGAVFRKVEDEYRQIVYKAQVALNSGLVTYDQAVDMATKDFLSRGIRTVVYKNGSQHTVQEYARMVLRTAMKRAGLMAEGEIRTRLGIHTVYARFRSEACPLCMPWLGRLMVDDVYSNGTKEEAKELKCILLSEAMEQGFLHPNCKDTIATYDPELYKDNPENDPVLKSATRREEYEAKKRYEEEMKLNHAKQMKDKYTRLADNSLDKNNAIKYRKYADRWHSEIESIRNANAQGMGSLETYSGFSDYDRYKEIERVRGMVKDGGFEVFKDFARYEPVEWSCSYKHFGGKDYLEEVTSDFDPHSCQIYFIDDDDLFLGIHAHNHPVYTDWSVNVFSPDDINAMLVTGVREEYAVWYGGEHKLINNNVKKYLDLDDPTTLAWRRDAYKEYLYGIQRESWMPDKEFETQFAQDYSYAYQQFLEEAENLASEKFLKKLGLEHGWTEKFKIKNDTNIDKVFESLSDEQLEEWLKVKETYIEERCEQWLTENAEEYNCQYVKTTLE